MSKRRRAQHSGTQDLIAKEDVLKWLLEEGKETDARELCVRVARERQHLLEDSLLRAKSDKLRERANSIHEMEDEFDRALTNKSYKAEDCLLFDDMPRAMEIDMDGPPVIQFASKMCFAVESEHMIQIDVQRLGNLTGTSEAQYKSRDNTAVAGVQYEAATGKLVFQPGESAKTIEIALCDDRSWDTVLEFFVEIDTEGLVGAVRGKYLWQARVKIIDDDTFPTSRFKTEILDGKVDDISGFDLLLEFFKLCWSHPVIRVGTIKTICVNLVHTMRYGIRLFIGVYLVDIVFHRGDAADLDGQGEDGADETSVGNAMNAGFKDGKGGEVSTTQLIQLIVCAMAVLLPAMFAHFLDFKALGFRVGGTVRNMLRSALVSNFLSYDEKSRDQVDSGSLLMATMRDVDRLLKLGYMNILILFRSTAHMLTLLAVKLAASRVRNTPISPGVFSMLLVLPTVLSIFLVLRRRTIFEALLKKQNAEDKLVSRMNSVFAEYPLISAFHQRPKAIDSVEKSIKDQNSSGSDFAKVMLNNAYFVHWVDGLVTATYIVVRGFAVIAGHCSLGIYLMDINIIASISKEVETMYGVFVDWETVSPSLHTVVKLINLPLDLSHRMQINRLHKRHSDEQALQSQDQLNLDSLPIVIESPRFNYLSGKELHFNGSVSLNQESLIMLIGSHGQGKSTLLKLISSTLLPEVEDSGNSEPLKGVFVPAHLRTLHDMSECVFIHGTLMQNLTLGVNSADDDAQPERVSKICMQLGLDADVLHLLQVETILHWETAFSRSQLRLLGLARSLVYNPEVLCCDKPCVSLNDDACRRVIDVLRQFVEKRGIGQSPDTLLQRRPRTVIAADSNRTFMKSADQLISVSDTAICQVSKHDIE